MQKDPSQAPLGVGLSLTVDFLGWFGKNGEITANEQQLPPGQPQGHRDCPLRVLFSRGHTAPLSKVRRICIPKRKC